MTDYVLIHFDLNSWDINIPLRWLLLLIVVKWSFEQITMSESGGFGGEGGGGGWGDSIMMGFGKGAVGYIKHTHRKILTKYLTRSDSSYLKQFKQYDSKPDILDLVRYKEIRKFHLFHSS